MHAVKEDRTHGNTYVNKQFGIHVGLGKQHLQCGYVAVGFLRQPLDAEAATSQAFLQKTTRVKVVETVEETTFLYFTHILDVADETDWQT